ncbi:MAG: chemotaxis protein CheW [Burkholderiales bacterium]
MALIMNSTVAFDASDVAELESAGVNGHEEALLPPSVALARRSQHQGAAVRGSGNVESLIVRQAFRIGPLRLLAAFGEASELSEMVPCYRLPNTASWFTGFANLHGSLVPVFDIATYMGITRDTKSTPFLLVFGKGEGAAAVIVDGVPKRLRMTESDRADLPALPTALEDYVPLAYLQDGTVWLEFDHRRFIDVLAQQLAV